MDAICAAANYLKASGYADSPEGAIFAYNHADWYVDDVLTHARAYASIPPELISALTGLTEGARFPVAAAEATYEERDLHRSRDAEKDRIAGHRLFRRPPLDRDLGERRFSGHRRQRRHDLPRIDTTTGTIQTDAYGNRYTYSGLGTIARSHPVPRTLQQRHRGQRRPGPRERARRSRTSRRQPAVP